MQAHAATHSACCQRAAALLQACCSGC
jgi:hypothetical protein